MKTSVPQVLDEVEKVKSFDEKVKVLLSYNSTPLRGLLNLNFNPNLKMNLPEGEPPFKKDTSIPIGYSETNLYTEWRRFYIWVEPKPELSKVRKEQLFVQMLEGIHWKEAEVVCLAKDKKLHTRYKSLNEKLVRAAFPQLLPPPAPKPVQKQKEEVEVKKDGGPSSVDS
jgi:hypothetical protein